MKQCYINGESVPFERVCTHWSAWNRSEGRILNYRIHISSKEVIAVFNDYWNDLIEIESEPDACDLPEIDQVDIELRDASYPNLNVMIKEYPSLLCRYVLKYLQSEFIGFIVGGRDEPNANCIHFLTTLRELDLSEETFTIKGQAIMREVVKK